MRNSSLVLTFLFLLCAIVQAEEKDCKWSNDTPCVVIKGSTTNTSKLTEAGNSKVVLKQSDFDKHGIVDLKSSLAFANNVIGVQSGPTGQQTSVFTRGTNSNHTLVLLNGIPINDQSTTNGAYDFGQDFLSNISYIEIYKGPSAVHFGPDAVGGAINIVTTTDVENKMYIDQDNINGNWYTYKNGWQINVKGGLHESENESALSGASEKDGTKNKSVSVNANKWLNHEWFFWTSLWGRNTLSDLDGHSLALQNGYDSNNSLYAWQGGFEKQSRNTKSYVTLHTHAHDREYKSPGNEFDNYESNAYTVRAEHTDNSNDKFSWGIGSEYRNDSAMFENQGSYYNSNLDANYNTFGIFANTGYKFNDNLIGSFHFRTDDNSTVGNNDSLKIGLQYNDILPNLNLRTSYSEAHKLPSLYELSGADNYNYKGNINLNSELSESIELALDYSIDTKSMFSFTVFESEITNLIEYSNNTYVNSSGIAKQSGLEVAYNYINEKSQFKVFATSLSTKKANGTDQLRRPEHSLGANYVKVLDKGLNFNIDYEFFGKHFDTHNVTYNTITMPETHLVNIGLSKDYYGYDIGFRINNLLDEDYEKPHGFSQNKQKLGFFIKKSF